MFRLVVSFARVTDVTVGDVVSAVVPVTKFLDSQLSVLPAVSEFQRVLEISGSRAPSYLDFLRCAYLQSGNPKAADAILAEMDKLGATGAAGPSYWAATFIALNEPTCALEEGFVNNDGNLISLMDPHFGALHQDPRYVNLLRQAGLEP